MKKSNKKFSVAALVVGLVISGVAAAVTAGPYTGIGDGNGNIIWTNSITGAQIKCDEAMTTCTVTRKAQF